MAELPDNTAPESPVEERMSEFGEYLRDLRKQARYSLGELATELRKRGVSKHGTSRQYLGALERGEVTNPSPELLFELAKVLDAMSSEYWLLAGHVPPGPDGEAYADLIRAAHREGFSRMLEDEGLNDAMIQNVLSTVSDETIDRVVRREEPLVIKQQVSAEERAGHQALGHEAHLIDEPVIAGLSDSASDYVGKVAADFDTASSAMMASRAPQWRRPKPDEIQAGRDARIVVDRPLDRNERKALQDVARVIAHLLGR